MVPLWPGIGKNVSFKSTVPTDYISSPAGFLEAWWFFTFKIVHWTPSLSLLTFSSVNRQTKRTHWCYQWFASVESLPDSQGEREAWAVGSLPHLQDPPDARHTCIKIKVPLVSHGFRPQRRDWEMKREPGFWSCQCHTLTVGLHLVTRASVSSLLKRGWSHCMASSHRGRALNQLMNVDMPWKIYKGFYSFNVSFY